VDGYYIAAKQAWVLCMGCSDHFVAIRSNVSDMNSAPQAGLRVEVDRVPVQISVLIDCRMRRECVGRLPDLDRTAGRTDS
jgi:hypothetical protein